ncbi:hypothetical protein [Streptomyces sp. CB00455]|uniref:hypothetical protein n=1 Tax=Streptomyces sp. CB00455 TaxID=1703927 RepID=UPI000A838098|nr:hypothetical protein [Streptomyces sp. CB00455]
MTGTDIALAGLLAAFGVTGGTAWLAAGRRRGPAGIAAGVLAVQGALHLVFSGSQAAVSASEAAHRHHGMPAMGGMNGMAGMSGMDGAQAVGGGAAAAETPATLADMASTAGHGGAGMIAAHVLAGLFCAVWLARGEAAVFRLARALAAAALHAARPLARALALLRTPVPAPKAPRAGAPRPRHERPRRLRGAVYAHAVVRRGPPPVGAFRATAPGRPSRA